MERGGLGVRQMYGLKVDSVGFLIINPAHHERKRKEKEKVEEEKSPT